MPGHVALEPSPPFVGAFARGRTRISGGHFRSHYHEVIRVRLFALPIVFCSSLCLYGQTDDRQVIEGTDLRKFATIESFEPGKLPGWREAIQCGPNALYVLLRLHGWHGSLSEIRSAAQVDDQSGCSLFDLEKCGRQFGVRTSTVSGNCNSLTSELPFIAHMDRTDSNVGHFVVVLAFGTDRLSGAKAAMVYDPILAHEYDLPLAEFERYWSSYALVVEKNWYSPKHICVTIFLGVAVGLVVRKMRKRKGK